MAQTERLAAHPSQLPSRGQSKKRDMLLKTLLGDEILALKTRLGELNDERQELFDEGFPLVGWREQGKVSKTNTIQVWLRSTKPVFNGKKSKYIGVLDSPADVKLRAGIRRRDRVKVIDRELKQLRIEYHSARIAAR